MNEGSQLTRVATDNSTQRALLTEYVAPLDATCDVVAPENVAFQYRLAGPFIRVWAYSLDLLFITIYIVVTMVVFAFATEKIGEYLGYRAAEAIGMTVLFANLLFTFWFWNALFETFWNGRTLGKAITGLRTLTTSGLPISFGQAFLRNVLRYVDLFLGPFSALLMGSNDRMSRLGDLAAGTMVVIETRDYKRKSTTSFVEPIVHNIESKIPDDFEISSSLHRALALYVSRRDEISPARRYEIAVELVGVLAKRANFSYRVEPDAFLRALYQRSLGLERHI